MSNKNLLTYGARVSSVQQVYYLPVVTVPPSTSPISTIYCFLGKAEPWEDDQNPPAPTQDQQAIKQLFKNMFVVKEVKSSDIAPVVQRNNWTTGTIYDYYQDNVDMFEEDSNGFIVKHFYVINKYDQVFKCLWNNNGATSTSEPVFEPGSFNLNNVYTGADGYKWKYIYTITASQKLKFMDNTWIPVPVSVIGVPNPLLSAAGAGSLDTINVVNGGSGYDAANDIISVVITGDGVGAAATATVTNGAISDIIVTNPGSNYTHANAAISSTLGANCVLTTAASPIGGHGFLPIAELGCTRIMLVTEFTGSENNYIPTNIDFHQVGILINPVTLQSNPYSANGEIYKTTTDLVVAPGLGVFTEDEMLYQGTSLATATFTARVLSFDTASNVIRLINTTGTLITNAPVYGDSSKTARTLLNYTTPNFVIYSGNLAFVENRTSVQRSADGIEQFKFVLRY